MNRWLAFGAGAAVTGLALYYFFISPNGTKTLYFNDKFLGVFGGTGIMGDDASSFGLDDVARGAVLLTAGALGVKVAHMVGLPTSTKLPLMA